MGGGCTGRDVTLHIFPPVPPAHAPSLSHTYLILGGGGIVRTPVHNEGGSICSHK